MLHKIQPEPSRSPSEEVVSGRILETSTKGSNSLVKVTEVNGKALQRSVHLRFSVWESGNFGHATPPLNQILDLRVYETAAWWVSLGSSRSSEGNRICADRGLGFRRNLPASGRSFNGGGLDRVITHDTIRKTTGSEYRRWGEP
jgi:hypothetical protein